MWFECFYLFKDTFFSKLGDCEWGIIKKILVQDAITLAKNFNLQDKFFWVSKLGILKFKKNLLLWNFGELSTTKGFLEKKFSADVSLKLTLT